jgi:hypothetical protein
MMELLYSSLLDRGHSTDYPRYATVSGIHLVGLRRSLVRDTQPR